MIKKNQIFLYILYFCLIILISISYYFISRYSQLYTAVNYSSNIPLFITQEVILILFGVSLGLDYILKEIKKVGLWRFNIFRLLVLALPCFIFFLIRLLAVCGVAFTHPILFNILKFTTLTPVFFQTFLGYILITSLKKQDNGGSIKV